MDPNGGIGPNGPRLDTNTGQPQTQNLTGDLSNVESQGAPLSVQAGAINNSMNTQQPQFTPPATPMAPNMGVSEPPQNIQPEVPLIPPSPGGDKKVIIIAIISVVVCLIIGAAMFFVGFASGKSKGKAESDSAWQKKEAERQAAESEKNKDDSADAAEKLDLGDLQDPQYIDETIEGEIGDQTMASDGLVLKVTNIERNFKTDDPNYKLDPSKELVKVNFIIGNVTKDKPKDMNSFGFRLENSSNAKLVPENIASYTDKFDTVKLDPGAQTKGSIVYLVNKDEVPLKFVREQVYRISGQNKEVTTRTVITVAK